MHELIMRDKKLQNILALWLSIGFKASNAITYIAIKLFTDADNGVSRFAINFTN